MKVIPWTALARLMVYSRVTTSCVLPMAARGWFTFLCALSRGLPGVDAPGLSHFPLASEKKVRVGPIPVKSATRVFVDGWKTARFAPPGSGRFQAAQKSHAGTRGGTKYFRDDDWTAGAKPRARTAARPPDRVSGLSSAAFRSRTACVTRGGAWRAGSSVRWCLGRASARVQRCAIRRGKRIFDSLVGSSEI